MAHTAALISYPCFKDLEKSNINFVESVSHQKKSRKSRFDKKESAVLKENYNVGLNSTCNRENSTTNTSRVRKKDVEILPTLLENEEKEENLNKLGEIGKISDWPTSFEQMNDCEGTDAIVSSLEGEAKTKRRLSNHSLITYDAFEELPARELLNLNMQQRNLKLTSNSAERRRDPSISDLSSPKNETDRSKLQVINCEPYITLMPNTNEFKELNVDESPQEPMKSNWNVLVSTMKETTKRGPDPRAQSTRHWGIALRVIWMISMIAAIAFVIVYNAATQSSGTQKPEQSFVMSSAPFDVDIEPKT